MTSPQRQPSPPRSEHPAREPQPWLVRDATEGECAALGRLLVEVYAALPGFPPAHEQRAYYALLADVGRLRERPGVRVLVATSENGRLAGGIVYFGVMSEYGSGGAAPTLDNTSGIRLLAVDPRYRERGLGKALTVACVALARAAGHAEVVLHTTAAMQAAWALYERLGFARDPALDFRQGDLCVLGFRLRLD